jgi:glycosyltransferase involved in cell wall biosynthesis
MIKVVLVPSSVDLVGVSTHVYNLAKLLNECEALDIVVCPRKGALSDKLNESGIPSVVVEMSYHPSSFLRSSFSLRKFLRTRANANVIHVHGRFPLFVSWMPLLADPSACFVATVHQFFQVSSRGLFGWKAMMETFLLQKMRRICCVSQALRQETISTLGCKWENHVDVIPNWIEPISYGKIPRRSRESESEGVIREKEFKVCAIGRLSSEKGFDVLIEALSILQKEGVYGQCDIFGEGPEENTLVTLAEQRGLANRICFRHSVSDVRQLLPGYDAVVIPSRSESFGLVALEAYDASVPLVASNIPGLRATVADGRSAILFESGSGASLATALRTLFDSNTLAKDLTRCGKELLKDYLAGPKMRDRCLDFYREALAVNG